MPAKVKFEDAMRKNPDALKRASAVAKKHGTWDNDADDEKNIKTNYKAMPQQHKDMIDDIFKEYNLTVVMVGNRNFTITEDSNRVVAKVTKSLTEFEKVEEPNTKKLLELENMIKTLAEQRDPLVKRNDELEKKLKAIEAERDGLKQARWERWGVRLFDLMQTVLAKVLDKPIEFAKAGIAVCLFYRVVIVVNYVTNLFYEGMKSISEQWNGKTEIAAKIANIINATNTTENVTNSNATNVTNPEVDITSKAAPVVDETWTISDHIVPMAVATTMLFCAFGILYCCNRSKDPKYEAVKNAVAEENSVLAKSARRAAKAEKAAKHADKLAAKLVAKKAVVEKKVETPSESDDDDENVTEEDYRRAVEYFAQQNPE
jgi:hypothetical protein